jgi:hypothetical protein
MPLPYLALYPQLAWSGDAFAVVWSETNAFDVQKSVKISIVRGTSLEATPPRELAGSLHGADPSPFVVWDGAAFVVIWADDTGLAMQRVTDDGQLQASTVHVVSAPAQDRWPYAFVRAGDRFALGWAQVASGYTTSVVMFGADGVALGQPIVLEADKLGGGVVLATPGSDLVAFWTLHSDYVFEPASTSEQGEISLIDPSGASIASTTKAEPSEIGKLIGSSDDAVFVSVVIPPSVLKWTRGGGLQTIGILEDIYPTPLAMDAAGCFVALRATGMTPDDGATGTVAEVLDDRFSPRSEVTLAVDPKAALAPGSWNLISTGQDFGAVWTEIAPGNSTTHLYFGRLEKR